MDHMCSLCPYVTKSQAELIGHVIKRHKHCPNFIAHCSAVGCGASFRKHSAFVRHCYRKHLNSFSNAEPDAMNDVMDLETECDVVDNCDAANDDAAFVLKLTALHKLSQRAVIDVMDCTQELVNSKLTLVKDKLNTILLPDQLHILNDECFSPRLFQEVDTEHKQEKFFESRFMYIPPISVVLGKVERTRKLGGVHKTVDSDDCGYVVPFLSQLKALLSMPEIQEHLSSEERDNDLMVDYYDGLYFNNHAFLKKHPKCLCFGIYTDDFEVVNPIGSHRKKHKLTAFYWTLLNIPVELRSKLNVIQLAALAKSAYIKIHGSDKLLLDICTGLQMLYDGCVLDIPNVGKRRYHGLLCFVCADTLAAQQLGGFKEGVGQAYKPCRTCDIEKADMHQVHYASDCCIRDETEHRDRAETIQTLSKKTQKYWSKHWGINKPSVLFDVPGFSLTQCILHDPMHVLLEGIARTEIKGLLNVCIREKKYFTLNELNSRIMNFPYSSVECRDKPQPFDAKSLEPSSVVCQTAASMKTLLTVLPCLIGDLVPVDDPHWINFIRLLQIMLLSLSPVASLITVQSLEQLVAAHNAAFIKLYPNDSFTPKMHYLVHFPTQLLDFGPLRVHWCMRYEAKNGFFKSKRWYNFRNISKSLSSHHQRWMCLQMLGTSGSRSTTYLYAGDDVTEGYSVSARDEITVSSHFDLSHDAAIMISPKICVRGHTYMAGNVLIESNEEEPQFVIIHRILIINHTKILHCYRLRIVRFESHMNMFAVEKTRSEVFLQPKNLTYTWPQIVHTKDGELFVMMYCVEDVWIL